MSQRPDQSATTFGDTPEPAGGQRQAAETRARLAKAQAIAKVLERAGATGPEVPGIDDKGRRAAEALAGVRRGSDDTWAMAADIVSTSHALICRLPADPFEAFG